MRGIDATISRVAVTDVTVLVSGESGVGKELVAWTIHRRSRRSDRPFVRVNCAALPLELLESELFGHERGAFTGANHQKRGKFEQAHTGTIFLDQISEMPLSVQAKLLQVLQDHEFARLGSERDIRVDVRVIAATNRDLTRYVAQGGFREDLFYRLNVVHLQVPPLRERSEEIPILVRHFLALYGHRFGRKPQDISSAVLERFRHYSWPGNVRELENIVQRIVVLGSESIVDELTEPERRWSPRNGKAAVPEAMENGSAFDEAMENGSAFDEAMENGSAFDEGLGLKELARRAAETAEREALKRMLDRVRWRRVEAAHRLRISDKTLREKIRQYGLDRFES
jgi:DNA-binding NtrC family response regulator